MAGNGDRGGLLSAGGILSIIVGVFEVLGGGFVLAVTALDVPMWEPDIPFVPRFSTLLPVETAATPLLIAGIVFLVLGILAIVGGVSALKRLSFGMALVGALCAFLPVNVLGLLALIFVSLGSGEFTTEDI
jgi:hypothetical protein